MDFVEEFTVLYAELAKMYNLSPNLSPVEALRARADEYEAFLNIVVDNAIAAQLQSDIKMLRTVADKAEEVFGNSGNSGDANVRTIQPH